MLNSIFLIAKLLNVAVALKLEYVLQGPQERGDTLVNFRRLSIDDGQHNPTCEDATGTKLLALGLRLYFQRYVACPDQYRECTSLLRNYARERALSNMGDMMSVQTRSEAHQGPRRKMTMVG